MNVGEDVKFVVDLSATDHVHNLHKHKSGENEGKVARRTVFHFHLHGIEIVSIPVLSATRVNEACRFVELKSNVGLRDYILTGKQEHEKHNALPDSLGEDVFNHFTRYDVIILVLRHSF